MTFAVFVSPVWKLRKKAIADLNGRRENFVNPQKS